MFTFNGHREGLTAPRRFWVLNEHMPEQIEIDSCAQRRSDLAPFRYKYSTVWILYFEMFARFGVFLPFATLRLFGFSVCAADNWSANAAMAGSGPVTT